MQSKRKKGKMIPDEIKADLDSWFDKRIKEWGELKKLHYSLLGIRKEDYPIAWQGMIDDVIFTYSEIGDTLVENEGKIDCLPREIRMDIVPFLKRKAKEYPDETSKEAMELADIIQNRVPSCTMAGRVNNAWLKRRGYSKDDLIVKDNIRQVKLRQVKTTESIK